jgi:hypothetical protein
VVKILVFLLSVIPTVILADSQYTNSNKVYLLVDGAGANITIDQNGTRNRVYGIDDRRAEINGTNNTVNIKQTGRNLIRLEQIGNNNTLITEQVNVGSSNQNIQKISAQGNNISVSAQQNNYGGTSIHSLEATVVGNGHVITVDQRGEGAHGATINLTNAGGASNIMLNQLGNTGATYSITQSCANLSGCSVSVTQGQ